MIRDARSRVCRKRSGPRSPERSRGATPDLGHVTKIPVEIGDRTLPRVYVSVYHEQALADNKLAALLDPRRTAPLELALADPAALRVLDRKSLLGLAQSVRPGVSDPRVERWIQDAVGANRLLRVLARSAPKRAAARGILSRR